MTRKPQKQKRKAQQDLSTAAASQEVEFQLDPHCSQEVPAESEARIQKECSRPLPNKEIILVGMPEQKDEDQDPDAVDRFIKNWFATYYRLPTEIIQRAVGIPANRINFRKRKIDSLLKDPMVRPRKVLVTCTLEIYKDYIWNLQRESKWQKTGWSMLPSKFDQERLLHGRGQPSFMQKANRGTPRKLNILCWNARSWSDVKMADVERLHPDWDILAILETAETTTNIHNVPPDCFSMGFHAFTLHLSNPNPVGNIGGIRVFVRQRHKKYITVHGTNNEEQYIWIKILGQHQPTFVAFTYLPTEKSKLLELRSRQRETIFDKLHQEAASLRQKGKVVIMGDLNTHFFDQQVPSKENDQSTERFERMAAHQLDGKMDAQTRQRIAPAKARLQDLNMILVNGVARFPGTEAFTYHAPGEVKTTVDYVVAQRENIHDILQFRILPCIYGLDHNPLRIQLQLLVPDEATQAKPKLQQRRVYILKQGLEEAFKKYVDSQLRNWDSEAHPLVQAYHFHSLLLAALQQFGKRRRDDCDKRKPHNCHRVLRDRTCSVIRKAIHDKLSVKPDFKTTMEFKLLSQVYKQRRKAVITAKAQQRTRQTILNVKKGRREFWKILKKDRPPPVLTAVDVWEKHLESLYARPEQSSAEIAHSSPLDPIEKISPVQVEEAIRKMKTGKAADEYGIRIEHLKMLDQTLLSTILTGIFTGCLHEGKVPDQWNRGVLYPLFKAGDLMLSKNYRTITLIAILSKILSTIANEELQPHRDNIYQKFLAGFRKEYAATDHAFALRIIYERQLKRKGKLYALFLDFEKAFDSYPGSSYGRS